MEDGKRKQCRDEGTELVFSFGLPCQFLLILRGDGWGVSVGGLSSSSKR